jgi:mannose-6-phosphate isomerase-like protein (cupin superfamily)
VTFARRSGPPALARSDTRPQELTFLGARARVLASGEDTNGAFSLVDMIAVPPRQMPPLHVHHSEDEGFYLIEGEGRFHLPGRELTLRPGDFLLAPRGVPHTYRTGDEGARWLVTSTPAGFERFVIRIAALQAPTTEALAAVAAEHGIEILGPPGTLP